MKPFDRNAFALWFAGFQIPPSVESGARWQHERSLIESTDLRFDLRKAQDAAVIACRDYARARGDLAAAEERIKRLERACDLAVGKLHDLERLQRAKIG